MKKSEINFENYGNKNTNVFINQCIFSALGSDPETIEYKTKVDRLVEMSTDTESFIDGYLGTEEFKNRQAYAVLCQHCRPNKVFYKIREILGKECIKTMSDAGGLKIGNEKFSIIIPNGYGDGYTYFGVFDKGEWNSHFLHYFTRVDGEFDVYSYDCGNETIEHLSGSYGVYTGEGFVVFEKWEKEDQIAQQLRSSGEWNIELLSELCDLAGMSKEWEESDGETFESVAYAAAEKLGVEII